MQAAAAILARPVCNLLGCTFPLVLLSEHAASAAAAIEAGGFAFLPLVTAASARLIPRRFGIAFDSPAPETIAAAIARGPAAVLLASASAPAPAALQAIGAAHIVLVRRIASAPDALSAERAGSHALIADCNDFSELSAIIAATNIAVLASGPAHAQTFATALALGADGLATTVAEPSALISATAALLDSGAAPPAERTSYASPACFAEEAEDAFMGFVPHSELVPALNGALEEARAATLLTRDPALASFHAHVVRWCGVLTTAILTAGERPSRRAAALPPAAADPAEVLDKVAQRRASTLSALLPHIRDDAIYAALTAMLSRSVPALAPSPSATELG